MATNDPKLDALTKSVDSLVKAIQSRNGFGSNQQDNGTRAARGGSANGAATRDMARNTKAVAESLEELHESMASGPVTIAQHFRTMAKNIDPLNRVFSRLEDTVQKASLTHGKAYSSSARVAFDYVKAMNGNIKNIKEVTSLYGEFTATLQDIVDNRDDYEKNQAVHNARLKKLQNIKEKLMEEEVHNADGSISKLIDLTEGLNAPLKKFIDNLGNPKTAKMTEIAAEGVEKAGTKFKAFNDVMGEYISGIEKELIEGRKKLQKATEDMVAAIKTGFVNDLAKIPSIIGDRLRQGFESNEFMQAIRLGLSPQDLNKFRADNRFMLGALGDFGKSLDLVADGTVASWQDQYKQSGLIGQEANALLQTQLRTAETQGIRFSKEINESMLDSAKLIQQTFGGSITDASQMLADYTSQMQIVNQLNQKDTDEERAALLKEVAARLALTKQMGLQTEFVKEQLRQQHNVRYADVSSRYRQGIMSRLYMRQANRRGGNFTEEDIATAQRISTIGVTDEQSKTAMLALQQKIGGYENSRENYRSGLSSQREINRSLIQDIPRQYFMDALNPLLGNKQALAEQSIYSEGQKRLLGDVTGAEFLGQMRANSEKVTESFSALDAVILEVKESFGGLVANPGGGAASAAISGATDIVGQILLYRFLGKAGAKVFGKASGAAGAGGGIGKMLSSLPGAAAVGGFGSKVASSGVGQFGGKVLGGAAKRIPLLGALIGGGMSYVDGISSGKTQGAALSSAGGSALGGAGGALAGAAAGAAIGSVVPILGTAVGGIIGGILGGWGGSVLGEKVGEGAYDFFKGEGSNLGTTADGMNGIVRDANGNPISQAENGLPSSQASLAKIAETTEKQYNLSQEEALAAENRYEQSNAAADRRATAQERAAEFGAAYQSRFAS